MKHLQPYNKWEVSSIGIKTWSQSTHEYSSNSKTHKLPSCEDKSFSIMHLVCGVKIGEGSQLNPQTNWFPIYIEYQGYRINKDR